jgi:hypothetical protein
MRQQPPNARFWEWINGGRVKITLRPQQTLEWQRCEPADEGWHSLRQRWTHDGDGVENEYISESLDCDGRFDSGGESRCPLADLATVEAGDGFMVPDWQKADAWQRDHAAEAAGY